MKLRHVLRAQIALLAFAQLMLPSVGVLHAHETELRGHDSGASERRTVHEHGIGLPHDHAPDPASNDPAPTGFQVLGSPVAAARAAATHWTAGWSTSSVPCKPTVREALRTTGPAAGLCVRGYLLGACRAVGPPLDLLPWAIAGPQLVDAQPLRGPPSSA